MKNLTKNQKRIKRAILPILRRYHISKAGIFGSYARGEEKKKSDIDILIPFEGKKSLFDLIELEMKLEKKTGKKVQVVTYKSLHPFLKERILKEEVRLL